MPRNLSIPPESFEEILAWLNSDREVAATMYVQLRLDLAKLFLWGRCSDVEGLTDEVFDRVAKKVHEVRPSYVGDPRHYFRAVAKNLIKEFHRSVKAHVSLDDAELTHQRTREFVEDSGSIEDCLQVCLKELTSERRDLILSYYAKEKQAKITHRNVLASELGVTPEALRVKVYRIRASLDQCIQKCLAQKIQ
jgi:RNA polymerase sigma factor (sigma-70 family)